MKWLAVAVLLFAAPAHSGEWAEQHGPQFVFAWSEDDVATVRRAMAKLEDENIVYPDGIDVSLMDRRARILGKLQPPGVLMFGMWWDIQLVDAAGRPWWVQPMTLPETVLTGFAVSRDRYCRPEDQDIDDLQFLEAGVECYVHNTAAIALYERIEKTRHMSPGGAEPASGHK